MVAAEMLSNASLAELLSARARRTPRYRLALDIVGGVLIIAVALWARPGGWLTVASTGACLAFYGLWAVAELQLLPRPWPERTSHERFWIAVQRASGFFGVSTFVLFLFAALGVALGPIQS